MTCRVGPKALDIAATLTTRRSRVLVSLSKRDPVWSNGPLARPTQWVAKTVAVFETLERPPMFARLRSLTATHSQFPPLVLMAMLLHCHFAIGQDAILRADTTRAAQGSATLVPVKIYLEVTAGSFNGTSFDVSSTLGFDSIVIEPTILGVTPDVATVTLTSVVIELDDSLTPTPVAGPFEPIHIATAFYNASALAPGAFATVTIGSAIIDTGSSTFTPILLTGAVFADGNSESQLYFSDPDLDEVYRVVLDSSGAIASTTPVTPGPNGVRTIAVDANGMAWMPEEGNSLSRYNGLTLVDTITVGFAPAVIGIDSEGNGWIGQLVDDTLTKVSPAGQVLYGPGGALGPGIPIAASPIRIVGDRNGFVYVLSDGASNGFVQKFGPDGELVWTITTSGADPRGLGVDREGYIWVGSSNQVQIFSSDGSLDDTISLGTASVTGMVLRRGNSEQDGLIPQGTEAWVVHNDLGQTGLRRVRRDGSVAVDLSGLTCTTDSARGVFVDGDGQVWGYGESGCVFSLDTTTTGAPTVLEEIDGVLGGTPMTLLFGDISGYEQANALHPDDAIYGDFDGDTVLNGDELDLGLNPWVFNTDFVAPVEALTCVFDEENIVIDWTNGALDYDSVFVTVNGVETELPGFDEMSTILAPTDNVYCIEVEAYDLSSDTRSAIRSCKVAVGPGAIEFEAPVGVSIFDVTSSGSSSPGSPTYYATDVAARGIIAATQFSGANQIENPFTGGLVPRGIAFDQTDGTTFGPAPSGTLLVTGFAPGQPTRLVRIDLTGAIVAPPVELLDETGASFSTSQPPGGIAHDEQSKTLLMVGPTGCLLLAYDVSEVAPLGPVSLTPFLTFEHPTPGSSLNGVELESFDTDGGVAWISQRESGSETFEIQRITVAPAGDVTLEPESLTLGAITEENAFGGFSFSPDPTSDGLVAVVGVSTSTLYGLSGISGLIPTEPEFDRGDCNDDGLFNIGDAIFTLSFLFTMGTEPACEDACDVNDDSLIDIGDGIYVLSALFVMGPAPFAPHMTCGVDPTADTLGCTSTMSCQ